MEFITDNVYSEREGSSGRLARDFIPDSVMERIFRLMNYYGRYKTIMTEIIDCIGPFLESLYYHLKDESQEESEIHKSFSHYERFAKKTTISKFLDSVEIYCTWMRNRKNPYLQDFITDFNKLLIKNSVSYKLAISSLGEITIKKLSESEFVQEKVESFVRLTSEKKFRKCQEIFIKGENCFAKRDFDGTLIRCNSTLETLFCIILEKGRGNIKDLYKEFSKRYEVPKMYQNAIPSINNLIFEIQKARSQYSEAIHGKNPDKDCENIDGIMEELTELVLGETANFGIFIIKTYNRIKK